MVGEMGQPQLLSCKGNPRKKKIVRPQKRSESMKARKRERRNMEEMMTMRRCSEKNQSQTITEPITTTAFPSCKLYDNPLYNSQQKQHHHHHHRHPLHFPISARKIAASLWDLAFFRPSMDSSNLDNTRAQLIELKAELESERKVRKKVESINKKLTKELLEQRKGREAMERVCEELVKEIGSDKAEIDKMKRETEEERKMLRVAEVLREERVHMKLAEAKILFEEKLLELELSKVEVSTEKVEKKNLEITNSSSTTTTTASAASSEFIANGLCGNLTSDDHHGGVRSTAKNQQRASPEAENPHIKRGIKGFVEFPKVVRAIGSRNRHLGTKLECQKAQLRLLLRQKSPFRVNNLIMG